jgi:hypothetical protein
MIKKKTALLNFRVTDIERYTIKDKAKKLNISTSKLIKNASLEFCKSDKQYFKIDKNISVLTLAFENYNEFNNLRNISNNLNQIAKKLNENKNVKSDVIIETMKILKENLKNINLTNIEIIKKLS